MSADDRLILVARVAGAFGVKGELRLRAFTEDPASLLAYPNLRRKDGSPGLTLISGRSMRSDILARAKEVATREDAERLRGLELYVARSDLPAPEDEEFYLADLVGLAAVDPDGAPLGHIRSVQNFGAGDILEVDPGEGAPSRYVAFTRERVPDVQISAGQLVIAPEPADLPET